MVWLRYELWEDHDGPSYRRASKAETDRLTAASPDSHLRNIFYAPSAAAAEAQYCALRGIGPYIVSPSDSEEPFTMAQLESQLIDFPHDERLARQPALPQSAAHPADGHSIAAAHDHEPQDSHAPPHADTVVDHADAHGAPAEASGDVHDSDIEHGHNDGHDHGDDHGHGDEQDHGQDHDHPAAGAAPANDLHAEPAQSPDHGPAPVPEGEHEPAQHGVEDSASQQADTVAAPSSAPDRTDGLGPITTVQPGAAARKKQGRKTNGFLAFLQFLIRMVMLAIILGAVIIGIGIATGALDAPTLLAQARQLPAQVRQSSIVQSLFP